MPRASAGRGGTRESWHQFFLGLPQYFTGASNKAVAVFLWLWWCNLTLTLNLTFIAPALSHCHSNCWDHNTQELYITASPPLNWRGLQFYQRMLTYSCTFTVAGCNCSTWNRAGTIPPHSMFVIVLHLSDIVWHRTVPPNLAALLLHGIWHVVWGICLDWP